MPQVTYPPIDFPIYDPGESWPGARWLEHFNGDLDTGIWLITLAVGTHPGLCPGMAWIRVISTGPSQSRDDDAAVATDALLDLLAVTTPALTPRKRTAHEHATARFMTDHVNGRTRWASATWLLDDRGRSSDVHVRWRLGRLRPSGARAFRTDGADKRRAPR